MRFVGFFVLYAAAATVATAQSQKNYRDRAEYDVYNEVAKDFDTSNFSRALTGLEKWSLKYPDSEFKNDRQMLYVQAYAGANQLTKAIDAAEALVSNDRSTDNPALLLRVLYTVVSTIQRIPDATAQQLATAGKAARRLETYGAAPQGVSAEVWASTQADLRSAAKAALLYIALSPASRAMKANDCAGAEGVAMKAMQEFPESVKAAWFLALAEVCLTKTNPGKASMALYELARAAALDSTQGMVDSKWQQENAMPYLERAYVQFHGPDPQGLKALRELAVQSPLPPSGFAIKSAGDIALEREEEFERLHPEFVLWMRIRNILSGNDGEHYFESDLKDSLVPRLQGILVEARPECQPRELRVAVRSPKDTRNPPAEISLKFEKPLTGRPDLGTELRWAGVPTAFTKEPLLLTMEVEPKKVEGLSLSPCQASPRKQTVPDRVH